MNKDLEFNLIRPFGPSIGKIQVPNNIINIINNYVDNLTSGQEITDYGHKLAGQVTQEIEIPKKILKEGVLEYLANITKQYIKMSTGQEITNFRLKSAWVVR